MPVDKPGRVLLHHIPLAFVKNRVSGGGRKGVDSSITLVPFIDFLIVLVVFLLLSFSGSELQVDAKLQVPEASNVENLDYAPIIAVNEDVVTIDGQLVAQVSDLKRSHEMAPIDKLVQNLETAKRNWSILHAGQPFPGAVILQADRTTDFLVIKKVMFSTAQAGFANISFAVNRRAAN